MSQITDEEVRKLAEQLGDWVQRDAILHIPPNAAVERGESGSWVECRLLVPWNKDELPWNSGD